MQSGLCWFNCVEMQSLRAERNSAFSPTKGSMDYLIAADKISATECTLAIFNLRFSILTFCYIFDLIMSFFFTSGNRTPGSRFYSDLLDTLADSVCIHQLVSSVVQRLGCSYNCRRLTCASLTRSN